MGARQRDWARRKRTLFIARLGGSCVDCGATEKLEFDHLKPRTWVARHRDSSWRMSTIAAEIEQGLIVLRCAECNKRKGAPAPEPPADLTPF